MSDLGRLLEMYSRWQQQIFPYGNYNDFIMKVEKLSSSSMLKAGVLSCFCGVASHWVPLGLV